MFDASKPFAFPDNRDTRALFERDANMYLMRMQTRYGDAILLPGACLLTEGSAVARTMPLGMSSVPHGTLREGGLTMGNDLVIPQSTIISPFIPPINRWTGRSRRYAMNWRAAGTLRNWESCWRLVLILCAKNDFVPLPMSIDDAMEVACELADLGFAYGSIRNATNAVRNAHVLNGLPSPTDTADFRQIMEGIARTIGIEPQFRKAPFLLEDVERSVAIARHDPIVNHAMLEMLVLILGYFTTRRRIELVALDYPEHVQLFPDRVSMTHYHSKMNQNRVAEVYHIPSLPQLPELCPLNMITRWLSRCDRPGPLFRRVTKSGIITDDRLSDKTVLRIVKKYAARLGYDPDDYGAHSLRAGFVTDALLAGMPETSIIEVTGHRSLESLRPYFRPRERAVNVTRALVEHYCA